MNSVIRRLTADNIDVQTVKDRFFEHWNTVFMIGEANYLKLHGDFPPVSDNNELLAFIMMGAARMFAKSITNVPYGTQEYWAAVEWMIEDLLPEGTKVSKPKIRIYYGGPDEEDE